MVVTGVFNMQKAEDTEGDNSSNSAASSTLRQKEVVVL